MTHLRIKICGVTTPEDAGHAARLGADAVGLNFYRPSPRYLDPERAPAVLDALPASVEAVGVFAETTLADARALACRLGRLGAVQLHGRPPLPDAGSPMRFVPAFAVRDRQGVQAITDYLDDCRARGCLPAAILVDAHAPGLYGGTGRTAPWELLADFRPPVPFWLAGGLTPDNVAEAVRLVRPDGVDVAGGVESAPGRKDPERMRRFIDQARCV